MKLRYHHIRWLVAVAALLVLPAMAQVRDTIDFDISDRTFEAITVDGETFNLYSYPDCDHIDQTGAPMLPVKYIRLSVPYNATNSTVTASGDWTSGSATRRIYPAPVPIPTDGSVTEDPEMVIDSTIYMTNAYWPAQPAELVGDGFLMGENHIVTVAVYPMLYNPGASRIRNYSQVQVTISYNTLGGTPANMLVRYDTRLRQQERQQAMALVSNPEQVEPFSIPASQAQHAPVLPLPDSVFTDTIGWTYGGMLKSVESYDYMVITTRALKPAFKRLLALKQQKGYSAGAVCVEDILSNIHVASGDKSQLPDGSFSYINDDAGKIREYLKECYRYGTKYVLFGGKSTKGLPFRYIDGKYKNNDFIPSDTYYSNLSVTWYVMNDTVCDYSRYSNPFLHNLYVGRILPSNLNEIANYTKKLLKYEFNPGNGNTSYLKSALYTQCEKMQNDNQARQAASQLISLFPDSVVFEEWNNDYPKGNNLISLINQNHFGYVNMHTHGSPAGFVINTYPIDRDIYNWGHPNKPYGVKSIHQYSAYHSNDSLNSFDFLNNDEYPFVFYSLACTSMAFDYPDKNYLSYNPGSALTLLDGTGCVAFLGNTRVGFIDDSFTIETNFQQAVLNGFYKLGPAETISKINSSSRHCKLAHNLMGDPELEIWTNEPQNYPSPIVSRGDNYINITGFVSGEYVYAGISDGQSQRMDSTLTGSFSFIDVNPNSTIMIYQHNYLPFIAPLYLQNERVVRTQYVIANDVYAGRNVDTNRTPGDVTIAKGSEYEIETKGQVVLGPGFTVEKGALFSVTQSDY